MPDELVGVHARRARRGLAAGGAGVHGDGAPVERLGAGAARGLCPGRGDERLQVAWSKLGLGLGLGSGIGLG